MQSLVIAPETIDVALRSCRWILDCIHQSECCCKMSLKVTHYVMYNFQGHLTYFQGVSECVCANVPPTAKVIWRWGHSLSAILVSSDRLEEPGSNSGPLGTRRVVYLLTATPRRLIIFKEYFCKKSRINLG